MRLPPRGPKRNPCWQFFSVERAAITPTAAAWLVDNFVNAALPAPATHHDLVKFICGSALRPIPVMTLSEELLSVSLTRGSTCFGMPGELLDEVARAHEGMGWWVTDEGLHMELIPPPSRVLELNPLDRLAGSLAVKKWDDFPLKKNTNLSAESLLEIAMKLDRDEIELIKMLQPKEWKTLKTYNQRAGRAGVFSFEQLARSPHSRMLRKRLSDARGKYITAISTAREPYSIPHEFWSKNPVAY